MSWALKGLSGPLKDAKTPLKPGLTLGRKGDVAINDSKASGLHARIDQKPDGGWVLVDTGSKNGVRVDGERIGSAELKVGLIFYIGDQGFEVVSDEPEVVMSAAAEPPPLEVPKRKGRLWNEVLASFLESNHENFSDSLKPVTPLEPAVVLDFTRGTQMNSRWVVGYGPRKIGAGVLDLPIFEAGAPAVCFELLPSGEGIIFKTAHPKIVTLNGQSVDNQVLRVGDSIRILETVIEVDFIE